MVRGASPGPAPADQARASNSRLTRSSWRTWPHRKLRRNVPRVDGALTTQPSAPAVPPVRKHVGVVDAVSSGQRRSHQRHHLVAGVGSAWGATQVQVPVNQLRQVQIPAQRGWQDQPSICHQAVVVEGDVDAIGVVIC